MGNWKRQKLCDVWVDSLSMDELLGELTTGLVLTLNPDHLHHLRRNPDFLRVYRSADFITSDSKYVYWSLGLLRRPIKEKISGSDLVPQFLHHHRDQPDTRVFFLGGQAPVAEVARERVNQREGREIVVGARSPSMNFVNNPDEIQSTIDQINACRANVVIVGLGAPKQELWIDQYRSDLPEVKIYMGVGATIDYEAGMVHRAPPWMTRNGLEWVYRLATEPKRYWRRYYRDLEFFWFVLLEAIGRYKPAEFLDNMKEGSA